MSLKYFLSRNEPKRFIWPTTQWVIWYCLEMVYLILDLSGDSVPLIICYRESTIKATNHPVGTQNDIISDLS